MWNQLIIDPSLSRDRKEELIKNIEELRRDCNEYFQKKNKQVRNLIEFNDGLLVWNPAKEVLCYILIRNDNEVRGFQTMLLSNPPMSDVFSIKLAEQNDKYLLLSGQKILIVVELPRKYGNEFLYEGGKSHMTLKSWSILERLFVCNEKLKLLESKWHPGTLTDQHVVILTNDNFIRFINIFEPDLPSQEIRLSSNSNDASFSDYTFSMFASSLGETAVSFDFGAPTVKYKSKNRGDEIESETLKVPMNEVYWPIYILKGNGDVLLIYSNLLNTYIAKKIFGPLVMLPYAEDNYGVDGCSLIVIHSNPSLIVIATSTGLLHHCIALEDPENKDSFLPDIILHVFETIELTLSLTSSNQIDNNYDLMLVKNQSKNDRYFCMHLAGIHVINVPFTQQLNAESDFEMDETIVEHLICTKPIASSSQEENFIPSGLSSKFHKGFLLSILLSSGELISQKLSTINFVKKDLNSTSSEFVGKEDLKMKKIDFYDRVMKLLQRESSTPLIKSKAQTSKFEYKDGLQFILNTTETLKKEYLAKFDSVAELIDKRVISLNKEKDIQIGNLNKLRMDANDLSRHLANLSGKYDQTLNRQEQLSTKIEGIVDRLMKKQTSLSEAEIKLMKTVHTYQEKIEEYKTTMNQIKLKYKYQEEAGCASKLEKLNVTSPTKQIATSKDITQIQRALKDQSENISFLINKINFIQQHCSNFKQV